MRRATILLTFVGLASRSLFVLGEPAARLVGDEHAWTAWAEELASPAVRFDPAASRLLFYPPGYPYFLAAALTWTGSWTGAKLLQAALGALLVPAVAFATRRVCGDRAALVAAALTACYPDLVWFGAHFWSETVFLVLLWWMIERLLAADAAERRSDALAAGALLGLAALTRETVLYFAPLAALWLAWRRPRGWRRAGAYLLAAGLIVLPWTYRNWVVYGAFVPVSTSSGLNLWQGNARMTREAVYAAYAQIPGRIAKYQAARRKGLEAILERQPTWFFEKLREEMPRFWEADSLALAHVEREAYGRVGPAWRPVLFALFEAPYLLLLPPFVLGFAAAPRSRGVALVVGFLVYYNLLHVVTHGFARYRLPVMPVLFAFAGLAVACRRELAARVVGSRRIAAAAIGVALLVSVAPSLLEETRRDEPVAPAQP